MTSENRNIYIVDDDDAVRDSLTLLLETHGYIVETFEDGEVFLNADPASKVGVVLLDIRMPGRNGIEILNDIMTLNSGLFIVMMSGHADIAIAVKAIKDGAFDFIENPFTSETSFRFWSAFILRWLRRMNPRRLNSLH